MQFSEVIDRRRSIRAFGAFDDDDVGESLGAPAHLRPVALMPLGYAAEMPERPPRRALSQLVRYERL